MLVVMQLGQWGIFIHSFWPPNIALPAVKSLLAASNHVVDHKLIIPRDSKECFPCGVLFTILFGHFPAQAQYMTASCSLLLVFASICCPQTFNGFFSDHPLTSPDPQGARRFLGTILRVSTPKVF